MESLSLLKSMTELHKVPNTSLIEIGCWSTSRDEAAEAANAIAESFVFVRNSPLVRLEIVDRAVTPVRPQRPNVPLNLLLGVVLGVGNGILAGAFTLLGIFIWRRSRPTLDEPPTPGASKKEPPEHTGMKAARWTARSFGTLLLAFYGLFILGEGLPPIGSQPEGVQLNFLALGLMLLGFVVGWKHEGAAALLIGTGWALWQVSEGRLKWNLFQTPVPVAALYAFCWWATRGRKTGVLAGAAIALAALLGLGQLFVPTNVFVRGTVTDAQTGRPVPDVEMKLLPRTARLLGKSHAPDARSAKDGRFGLYVSWYAEAKQVDILAAGYLRLTTNLGPRGLGQRTVRRDFRLHPSQSSAVESAVPPVVIATIPQSGAADVDPALTELRVTFSKDMATNRMWSLCQISKESFPQSAGQVHYVDNRTCVMPVKLEPGKTYALWFNRAQFNAFRDTQDHPSVPYQLVFETRQ
jgi:RNA polymerase sigma-70 factor (ECF subfamily)